MKYKSWCRTYVGELCKPPTAAYFCIADTVSSIASSYGPIMLQLTPFDRFESKSERFINGRRTLENFTVSSFACRELIYSP